MNNATFLNKTKETIFIVHPCTPNPQDYGKKIVIMINMIMIDINIDGL